MNTCVAPDFRAPNLGVLGGGQLGRMLVQSCVNFAVPVAVLDPDADAPCRPFCSRFVQGDFADEAAVYAFGKMVDVLTIEIEHVNVAALRRLEAEGVVVRPQPDILALVQDKGLQKQFYRDKGFPTADFVLLTGPPNAVTFPAVQKLRRSGYDGHGVQVLHTPADVARAFAEPSVLEQKVSIHKEIAIIAARSASGEIRTYPAVEMVFHPTAHLVEYLFAPADLDPRLAAECRALAEALTEALGLVGLLAVELFIDTNGKILINEIAPRPHNSGHHTIEANLTSQYEQHLRAILDLPLGATDALTSAVMVNLLGAEGHSGPPAYHGFREALALDGVKVHLYGKQTTRPFRKMGHVTILDRNLPEALRKAQMIRRHLSVISI